MSMFFLRRQQPLHAPLLPLAHLITVPWKINHHHHHHHQRYSHRRCCPPPTTRPLHTSAKLPRPHTHTKMGSKFWPKAGSPGILHHYTETLTTFEFTTADSTPKPHTVLFLGGLGDGLATTSYAADIVAALQPTPWSLFCLNLTSSYQSWGTGHLDRDTDEIAQAIRHIQSYKSTKYPSTAARDQKIVLMGHSTGSQCILHYLYRPNPHASTPTYDPYLVHVDRPVLDGAIMQAPVSDRQAIQSIIYEGFMGHTPAEMKNTYDTLVSMAKDAVKTDTQYETILPMSLTSYFGYANAPITARRFLSLASPDSPRSPGEDDLFSSDLTDERLDETFGIIARRGLLRQKLVVLMSGADGAVPDWVDKNKLLARWKESADNGGKTRIWDDEHSGIIPGATHGLSSGDQTEPRKWLVKRVMGYLDEVVEA